MRPDAIYRIASVTRQITAAATMTPVEECRLRLDDPVDDLLPEPSVRRVLDRPDAPVDDIVPPHRPITPQDLLEVPTVVLDRLAGQLQIADPSCVKRYTERRNTPFEHRDDIKVAHGLREFSEAEAEFAEWVRSRAWNTGQGPKTIFTDGVRWLLTNAVLLPGVSTLARTVARVRDQAVEEPHEKLADLL